MPLARLRTPYARAGRPAEYFWEVGSGAGAEEGEALAEILPSSEAGGEHGGGGGGFGLEHGEGTGRRRRGRPGAMRRTGPTPRPRR